jgi:peroxiredoxin
VPWLVGACSGLIVCGCLPGTTDWTRVDPPVPAPDFTLAQLDGGKTFRLSDLRGHIVVMEFWATWCGPCRFSTPSLDTMSRRYQGKAVAVLLINQGESEQTIRDWVAGRFVAPILLDADHRVAQQYGVSGIPQVFVVDAQGQIVYTHGGYRGGVEHNLKLILEELLSEEARHG